MSNTQQLDPDPENLLDKGILPLDRERRLLEEGIVFAQWSNGNNAPPFLITSRIPIDQAAARFFQKLWQGTTDLSAYQIPASA